MLLEKLQGKHPPAAAIPGGLNLQLLQAELTRIDVLVQREVRRWQIAGQDLGDAFRGLYLSDAQANGLLARPLFHSWGQSAALPPAEEQAIEQALARAKSQSRDLAQAAHAQGYTPRLEQVASAFELDSFEIDALLVCLAPCLDLRYERLYGYLQDDITRKRPGVSLLLDLLCPPGCERLARLEHFSMAARLVRHHLLEFLPDQDPGKMPLLSCALAVNETVFAWLLGYYQPGTGLSGHVELLSPQVGSEDALRADDWIQAEAPILDADPNPLYIFYGPDQEAQAATARLLAARLGRPMLAVDLPGAAGEGAALLSTLRLALRDAHLTGALPCLSGWDGCLEQNRPSPDLLQELTDFPGPAVICGREAWHPSGLARERRFYRRGFAIPGYPQRRELWAHFLGDGHSPGDAALDALAGQFALSSSQIRDAAAAARDAAAQNGGTVSPADLFAAARAHSNPGLARLARKLLPRYAWPDLVLPSDSLAQLAEIVAAVRGRTKVLDEWEVGRKLASSRGVTILFSGQPGTGKTMAAEIIAGELGLDLYKIDLSTIVSKYVGETEKNLERIFSEAETSNAILFFDEADALFGKRSEVRDSHDRYANIEISYLLQRMEAYDGVTILATNLRANLDEAFTRRLQYTVDFPFPDEADRLRIWQALFPPSVPRVTDLDLPMLARRYKLAGGNIRNILVSAAYLASADGQRVTMEHLLHSARRELQKMGRLSDEGS